MNTGKGPHVPVLADEIITYLRPKEGMVIADCTVGPGGHAGNILKKIGRTGYLVGIDADREALKTARSRLAGISGRFKLFHANFSDISIVLEKAKIAKIDGALFDLGISSLQLDDPERGFSIRSDGPLDMRMYKEAGMSAADIVNGYSKSGLAGIFKKYGDEPFAFKVADRIVKEREKRRIESTKKLAEVITEALPYSFRFRKIHPATKVFMALRIAVNKETENLDVGLDEVIRFLNKGARICVVSFHSIEDRIVKNKFRDLAAPGGIKIITKRPIRPASAETKSNPRSRSAKLRVAERV